MLSKNVLRDFTWISNIQVDESVMFYKINSGNTHNHSSYMISLGFGNSHDKIDSMNIA